MKGYNNLLAFHDSLSYFPAWTSATHALFIYVQPFIVFNYNCHNNATSHHEFSIPIGSMVLIRFTANHAMLWLWLSLLHRNCSIELKRWKESPVSVWFCNSGVMRRHCNKKKKRRERLRELLIIFPITRDNFRDLSSILNVTIYGWRTYIIL